jgi:hypothetical protein
MSENLKPLKRAFVEVGEAARTLLAADWETWGHAIIAFDTAVRDYDVRGLLADELPPNTIDIEAWLAQRANESGAIPGKAPLTLPARREERTAFLLDLVAYLATADHGGRYNAMIQLVGLGGNWDARVRLMADRLFRPLAADLLQRLATHIESETPAPTPPVTMSGDGNIYAPGGVHGSIIAQKGATVTDSNASYQPQTDGARQILSWLSPLNDVPAERLHDVRAALVTLARAADNNAAKLSETIAAVEVAADASPSLHDRLKDLAWGVATDVTAQAAIDRAPMVWRAIRAFFAVSTGQP